MKTWKNRHRSKKHKQRGGVKLTAQQKAKYAGIRYEINNKLRSISPTDTSLPTQEFRSIVKTLNTLLQPMINADASIKDTDDGVNLTDIDNTYSRYKELETRYDSNRVAAPVPAPAAPLPSAQPLVSIPGNGQPFRTLADCDKELADLRRKLADEQAGFARTQGQLDGEKTALLTRLGRLQIENAGHSGYIASLQKTRESLTGSNVTLKKTLDDITQMLTGHTDAVDVLQTVRNVRNALVTTKEEKDRLVSELRDELSALSETNARIIRDNDEEKGRLIAEYDGRIRNIQSDYDIQFRTLQSKHDVLDGALKQLQANGRKSDKDEIAAKTLELSALNAQLDALRQGQARLTAEHEEAIKLLRTRLDEEKQKLDTANSEKKTAEEESAAKQQDLDKLRDENAGISERLVAAEELASARERAVISASEAERAAKLAKDAIEVRLRTLEEDAARLRREADEGRGTKEERDAALLRANTADADALRARQEADAAAELLRQAQAAFADAEARLEAANVIQRSLEASTPKIRRITGNNGEEIGEGEGKRAPLMGEELTVRWEKGARDAKAWIFILFGQGDKQNKNTILVTEKPNEQGEGSFSFKSNIGGAVTAVIFDVIVHDADTFGL
jgi:chromosome segregation ATPase